MLKSDEVHAEDEDDNGVQLEVELEDELDGGVPVDARYEKVLARERDLERTRRGKNLLDDVPIAMKKFKGGHERRTATGFFPRSA